jgi:hypothetical protein
VVSMFLFPTTKGDSRRLLNESRIGSGFELSSLVGLLSQEHFFQDQFELVIIKGGLTNINELGWLALEMFLINPIFISLVLNHMKMGQ